MANDDDLSTVSSVLELLYTPNTPLISHMHHGDDDPEKIDPYTPIFTGERQEFGPNFLLPTGCDHTVPAVSELFLPDNMLDGWVIATNAYAASRLSRRRCRDVSRAHILRFIATVMYMGVVRLPSKDDYFVDPDDQTSDFWPRHSPIKLTHAMFKYLWRNFHTSFEANDPDYEVVELDEDDEEEIEEQEDATAGDVPMPPWYHKVEAFINHINKVSKSKSFTVKFIQALNDRSFASIRPTTRQTASTPTPPGSGQKQKRRRMSNTDPELPNCRLEGRNSDHQVLISNQQKRCIYCSYLLQLGKNGGSEELPKARYPMRKCSYCQVHICKDHWDVFHGQTE